MKVEISKTELVGCKQNHLKNFTFKPNIPISRMKMKCAQVNLLAYKVILAHKIMCHWSIVAHGVVPKLGKKER